MEAVGLVLTEERGPAGSQGSVSGNPSTELIWQLCSSRAFRTLRANSS